MLAILHSLGMFVADLFKSRCLLEAENLFLRHQLSIALRRAPPRLRLRGGDRALLVAYVRFSNRPFGVKRFQAIHHSSVDVAHGLALLFGLGTKGPSIMGYEDEVEQSFGRPCRQCDSRSKRTYELTSSIVPRGTSLHRWVELDFLLLHWI